MGSIQEQSFFAAAEYIPPDSIFEVTKIYNEDSFEKKVNLCPGVYRDGDGKPWILPSIQFAKELVKNIGHEYLAIAGLKVFRDAAVDLVFHDTIALAEDRVSICVFIKTTPRISSLWTTDCVVPISFRNWIPVACRHGSSTL